MMKRVIHTKTYLSNFNLGYNKKIEKVKTKKFKVILY